ncbi:anthocyanidin reductase 2S-flavan-3-ol-forming isoform X1 [Cinnamomum micranthum f. kanehirae]|uniref:Anthocyanidin reductase 2S-flavan-3-ol-forming isoform X1 n=1 Tax=Cinnamomum micranthum f. kanehirae TaxID=337451 RepID=A0A3S3QZP7_9MAGN|nr:anthocyanidin reductase 2S-flavan-3-ol-forming isoform X1 [Cinnamomum micranthum f. kanehirae]
MEKNMCVCVTGAAGFIGSWLVKKLLDKGYTVHATLRNLEDSSKVGLLKRLPHADTSLVLFRADIYNAEEFEPAIRGCAFVFHVATPMLHNNPTSNSKFKDTTEAAIAGVRSILGSCLRSGTVKRLIYTGSIMAASPLKEDGSNFKDSIDESCWTPLHHSFSYSSDLEQAYISSKTLSEKEVLSYCNIEDGGLEVVSLPCALVGGDTHLSHVPLSIEVVISQLTGKEVQYRQLKLLEEMLGSVPLIHIDDICEAHIFCLEQPSMAGRFLCASAYPTIAEMAKYFSDKYPEIQIAKEFAGPEIRIDCGSTKLTDMGFQFNYDLKRILDDSVQCARRLGLLK